MDEGHGPVARRVILEPRERQLERRPRLGDLRDHVARHPERRGHGIARDRERREQPRVSFRPDGVDPRELGHELLGEQRARGLERGVGDHLAADRDARDEVEEVSRRARPHEVLGQPARAGRAHARGDGRLDHLDLGPPLEAAGQRRARVGAEHEGARRRDAAFGELALDAEQLLDGAAGEGREAPHDRGRPARPGQVRLDPGSQLGERVGRHFGASAPRLVG